MYKDQETCEEIFGLTPTFINGKEYINRICDVLARDPLEDMEISELVYDVFCLLHEYDYYQEMDSSREAYLESKKKFKVKWFNKTPKDRFDKQIKNSEERLDKCLKTIKSELKEIFSV